MKKLFIAVALTVSMFANANEIITPSFFINDYNTEIINDSIHNSQVDTIKPVNYVKFYNIDSLVIKNVRNNRILIMDASNKIWADTTENVNISLPRGNYIIYSQANIKSIYKEY